MEESELTIKNIPKLVVPDNVFNSKKLRVASTIFKEEPKPDPTLGYTPELNNAKNRITSFADKWEKSVKFLLSDFELIDIFRNPRFSHQRYNEPIIKYREKFESDETKGAYPIFSRAYFKLWEVLGNTGVLSRYKEEGLTVANVAEGPGGFIHCLIDYRKNQNGVDWNKDSYHSITLKIGQNNDAKALDWDERRSKEYFELARSKNHNVILSYGADGTGNMFKLVNLEHFVNNDLKNKKCQLVTGDGGIDLSGDEEFSIQEIANAPLFFSEILYALHVQEETGCFILKIYDIYYNVTVQLILLLKQFYEKVTIVKPHTSRPASSEKYLVCENFKGITDDELKLLRGLLEDWVGKRDEWNGLSKETFTENILEFDFDQTNLESFRKQLSEFNTIFSDSQISKINHGLELVKRSFISADEVMKIKERQKRIAVAWCKAYNVPYNESITLSRKCFDNNSVQSRDQRHHRAYSRDYRFNNYDDNRWDNKRERRKNSRSKERESSNHGRSRKWIRKRDSSRSRSRSRSKSRDRERKNKSTLQFSIESHEGDMKKLEERKKRFGMK